MSLKLHRPEPDGSLAPAPVEGRDYRRTLRSRRWDPAPLTNPESNKTNAWIAIAGIALIAAGTFAVLVLGYWVGFWN
jgi:hypothetical protein